MKSSLRVSLIGVALGCAACSSSAKVDSLCTGGWTQWGQDATHSGNACAPAQPLNRVLAQVTFDPFVTAEQNEGGGGLFTHYPAPLVVGDDLYMMVKTGQYTPCDPPGSGQLADGGTACGQAAWDQQVWNLTDFRWTNGQLAKAWTFQSDWKPPTASFTRWEPMFQSAVSKNVVYVPGAGGSVYKLDRVTGATLAHLQPFTDPSIVVAGGLAVSATGDVYYNALKLDPADPLHADATGWLVKVAADDTVTTASYTSLAVGAPAPTDLCHDIFTRPTYQPPFPPPPDGGVPAAPPDVTCGSQRPSLNVVPAIAHDGTVYTVSRANFAKRYSYLVAVNPDLSPKWAASMRDILNDGCGVLEPADSPLALPDGGVINYHCRTGAIPGVDPLTNEKPAGYVDDSSSSSPVVLPDNSVLYGALTIYNTSRGHLMHFSKDGAALGNFDFGWDITPAVYPHDGTYSVILKDNHYFNWDQSPSKFFITRLDANLSPEWKALSTNTNSCTRLADGGVDCVSDSPDGFEWCINAPAVDPLGNVFANSEDGHLYKIDKTGKLTENIMLKLGLGAGYTPLSIDDQGRIYTLNAGDLFVIGR